MTMARKRLSVASLISRRVYNNCGVVESVGECWKNERGGCEFVFAFNAWLRLELFKIMGLS